MLASESILALAEPARLRNESLLAYGDAVIAAEADALQALRRSLDDNFVLAVETLMATTRRVVVSGIGKSGHVGRKIAATFAATGTPAFFVHAAEAAHGDLGMITPGDSLLLLSLSGETRELKQVAEFAADAGNPVIAIGSKPKSTIMRQADVRLVLPAVLEACPENISPTTSAIMMLAIGDALAIAMMNLRGISRKKLNALHPGGNIGQRLTPVSALMHGSHELPLVNQTMAMRDVIPEMTAHSFGIAGVVDDDGLLVGVITDGDLRRHVETLIESDARTVMTRDPAIIDVSSYAEDALNTMEASKITALFVTRAINPRRPVGLIHIHDILRAGLP